MEMSLNLGYAVRPSALGLRECHTSLAIRRLGRGTWCASRRCAGQEGNPRLDGVKKRWNEKLIARLAAKAWRPAHLQVTGGEIASLRPKLSHPISHPRGGPLPL